MGYQYKGKIPIEIGKKGKPLMPHGTWARMKKHYDDGEKPCEVCKEGVNKPRKLQPCGTYGAWKRHRAHGEDPDPACSFAASEYRRTLASRKSKEKN